MTNESSFNDENKTLSIPCGM